MRILVTGAGGYIGRHLVPMLQTAGHEVIPLRKWSCEPHRSAYDEAGELTLVGDLSLGCGNLVREAIKPDTVIHLAGMVEISLLPNPAGAHLPPIPGPCDIGALYRDNVLATANVLQYCLQAGVKHLIFASTQAVYGLSFDGGERYRPEPLEHYAASKRAAELLLEVGREQGLKVSIMRLPGVFGEDRRDGVVYQMCRDALSRKLITITTPYPLPINVMHIEDVVDAFAAALAVPEWVDESLTYDVTGREPCSLDLIAVDIMSLVGSAGLDSTQAADQPVMRLGSPGFLNWHPKPRKERLAQVLEEIRSEL